MANTQVKFGEWIEKGFNLYKENFVVLLLAALITAVLSSVTAGILAGPMWAGLILISLNLHDKKEPKPEVGMVFKGFNWFVETLLFVIVWGAILIAVSFLLFFIPCVGQLASLFVIWVVQALLMFGLYFIVDQNMKFWPASMKSIDAVKGNFWPFLGFFIVVSIIGGIGSVLCGIGVALTLPIMVCAITVGYRDIFSSGISEPAEEQAAQ